MDEISNDLLVDLSLIILIVFILYKSIRRQCKVLEYLLYMLMLLQQMVIIAIYNKDNVDYGSRTLLLMYNLQIFLLGNLI